ncbi:MAG: nucleotidyltransferase family protein, partial [Firmicutes bacterium]|nr:nucleotidyltransferase family protein [Bacillota bacterium]
MKAAGIICEFDPLHKGHVHLIDSVRREFSSDAVVCVMSGDFTQRGDPALLDKFKRAEAAVRCGADLVLELPAYFAVNSAPEFAYGGVSVLSGLGCVEVLAFGSESGEAGALLETAKQVIEKGPDADAGIKEGLAKGFSYPAARSKAFEDLGIKLPTGPNDILALEYIIESMKGGPSAGWSFLAVKRIGAAHGSKDDEEGIASASYIRDVLKEPGAKDEKLEIIRPFVPHESFEILKSSELFGSERERSFFALAGYALISRGAEYASGAVEMKEGLENRFIKAASSASSRDELIKAVKTRRYTYSSVNRMLTQTVLGLSSREYAGIKA